MFRLTLFRLFYSVLSYLSCYIHTHYSFHTYMLAGFRYFQLSLSLVHHRSDRFMIFEITDRFAPPHVPCKFAFALLMIRENKYTSQYLSAQ